MNDGEKEREKRPFAPYNPPSFDSHFYHFMKGTTIYNSFWNHLLSWYRAKLKYHNQILWIYYEDLVANHFLGVKKIAQFLDIPFENAEKCKTICFSFFSLFRDFSFFTYI